MVLLMLLIQTGATPSHLEPTLEKPLIFYERG